MNKKLIIITPIIFILSVLFANRIAAQGFNKAKDVDYFPRNEFYVQYGLPTILEFTSTIDHNMKSGDWIGKTRNHSFSGVAGVGYNFSINQALSFGLYAGLSRSNADIYMAHNEQEDFVSIYNSQIDNYVGMVSANWIFLTKGAFTFSSSVYLGTSYEKKDIDILHDRGVEIPKSKNSYKVAYHLSPIRVRYGETLGVFAELGFGYRGILNVGVSTQF